MKYRVLVILLFLVLAVACNSTPEAAAPATPTALPAPTEPSTAAPTAMSAATEPSTPTAVAPTSVPTIASAPTEATAPSPTAVTPPTPTATSAAAATSTPVPSPIPQAGGTAGFRDNLAVADQFILNLTDVPTPPGGQAYQGWLIDDGGATTSVGVLNLNPDGSVAFVWNSPATENLLSRYSRFQVTLEPAASSPSPTGRIALAGGLEGERLASARRLFVRNEGEPATPLNTAFALGLKAQTDVAVQHVQNALNAAAIGALPEMRAHLEHVVNILEGAAGPRFGDHDGNGVAENPGDGFGVIGYSSQTAQLLSAHQAVVTAVADVQAQSAAIEDKALEILPNQDMAAAAAQLGELKAMADQLKAAPVARLYQAAQDAISFEVSPVK